jgi:hypothetical protein
MVVDERTRHGLYTRLEEVLGSEHAVTLMEHLPPVGWADVATKHDLAALELRLGQRIDGLEERIDLKTKRLEERIDLKTEAVRHELLAAFHSELTAQTRLFIVAMTGSLATIASLAFAAAKLT